MIRREKALCQLFVHILLICCSTFLSFARHCRFLHLVVVLLLLLRRRRRLRGPDSIEEGRRDVRGALRQERRRRRRDPASASASAFETRGKGKRRHVRPLPPSLRPITAILPPSLAAAAGGKGRSVQKKRAAKLMERLQNN